MPKKQNPFRLVVSNDDPSFMRSSARGQFHAVVGKKVDTSATENQTPVVYPEKYANIMSPQPQNIYPQRTDR